MSLTRGLPYSLLIHAVALLVVVMYGNFVAQQTVRPSRAIPFQVRYEVPRPQVQAPAVEQETPVETPPEVVPQVETQPVELPPKEVPKPKPEVKKPEVKKPEAKPEVKPAEPVAKDPAPAQEKPVEQTASLAVGPAVGATDSDFPYDWYLTRIEGLIASNWNPRQIGFGQKAVVSCAVHFVIAASGAVSGAVLSHPSGIGVYDREALRAVQTTKLPPLPQEYRAGSLGVTFIFNLEPGSR